MRGELQIEVKYPAADAVQVGLQGSVDAHTFPRLEQAFGEFLKKGARWIVVDIGDMEYISSVGINFLVTSRSDLRRQGGDMILVGPKSHVKKIFTMLGLLEVLREAPSVEEAWAQVKTEAEAPPPGAGG